MRKHDFKFKSRAIQSVFPTPVGVLFPSERPDDSACERFDKAIKSGEDMRHAQKLLAAAVASIAGSGDFEVVAFLVVLPISKIFDYKDSYELSHCRTRIERHPRWNRIGANPAS